MRDDMSTKLVHLTKIVGKIENEGDERWQKYYSPREILEQILNDRCLIANDGFILGGKPNSSVCFSEAPISKLLLEVGQQGTKYMPFGVLLDKITVFELGGRPVIYQPYASYGELPASHSYRHVTFHYPNVDFTWEREWRNHGNVELTPEITTVIVPNRDEKDKIIRSVGDDWHYLVLDDLGVSLSNRDWANIPKPRRLEPL